MLLKLPDEILLMIVAYIQCPDDPSRTKTVLFSDEPSRRKKDLFSCRLSCARLSNVTSPFVFRKIDFVLGDYGCNLLNELSQSPLCRHVRELNCYFETYSERLASSREAFALMAGTSYDHTAWYERYCRGYRFQCSLEQDSWQMSQLTIAVSQFSNLRTIKLSRGWQDDDGGEEAYDPPTELSISPVGFWVFNAIMDALSSGQMNLEKLALGSFFDSDPGTHLFDQGLVGVIQRLPPTLNERFQRALRTLTTLKVHLPCNMARNLEVDDAEASLNYTGLSSIIQSAPHLEELRLSFAGFCHPAMPEAFLRSLEIPHLRVFDFEGVTFEGPDVLLDFLARHASTLTAIRLVTSYLETGSWETVAVGLKGTSINASIEISDLHSEFETELDGFWSEPRAFEDAVAHFIRERN